MSAFSFKIISISNTLTVRITSKSYTVRSVSPIHAQMAQWAGRKCCGQMRELQSCKLEITAGAVGVSSCRKPDLVRKRGGSSRQMDHFVLSK